MHRIVLKPMKRHVLFLEVKNFNCRYMKLGGQVERNQECQLMRVQGLVLCQEIDLCTFILIIGKIRFCIEKSIYMYVTYSSLISYVISTNCPRFHLSRMTDVAQIILTNSNS